MNELKTACDAYKKARDEFGLRATTFPRAHHAVLDEAVKNVAASAVATGLLLAGHNEGTTFDDERDAVLAKLDERLPKEKDAT